MTEYTIDNEGAIAAILTGTEFDVYDAGGTGLTKKATAAQMLTFVQSQAASSFPAAKYSTGALQAAAILAAALTGADYVNYDNTGTTPGSLPTDTAAAIIAALPASKQVVGFGWMIAIRNSSGSANTATITAGVGVTLTGTMTIAQTVTRYFAAKITGLGGSAAVTLQSMGISAAGA